MPLGNLAETLQRQPALWLEGQRLALEQENAVKNRLLQERTGIGQALMGLVGSLQQYQQMKSQADLAGKQLALEGRRVTSQEQDTASQIAARAVQAGKTAAETEKILQDMKFAPDLVAATLAQQFAETEATKFGTKRGGLLLPGEITAQQQAQEMGEENLLGARQQRGLQERLTPLKFKRERQEIAESKARTGLLGAQTLEAQAKAAEGPKIGGWQKGIQEQLDQVENAATGRMTQINALLANKDIVNLMMTTDKGKLALEQLAQEAATQQAQMAEIQRIRQLMSNPQSALTEDQAWALYGRLRGGQSGGAQPVETAGGSVGGAELDSIFE